MLPCKPTCTHYFDGCHRTCARWKEIQAKNRVEREEKKAYLEYYNQLCRSIVHQCSSPRFYR